MNLLDLLELLEVDAEVRSPANPLQPVAVGKLHYRTWTFSSTIRSPRSSPPGPVTLRRSPVCGS